MDNRYSVVEVTDPVERIPNVGFYVCDRDAEGDDAKASHLISFHGDDESAARDEADRLEANANAGQ